MAARSRMSVQAAEVARRLLLGRGPRGQVEVVVVATVMVHGYPWWAAVKLAAHDWS